jgi:signal transduction histidine kinase
MNLASVYEELNDFGKAIFYFEKSVELCRKSGYKIGVKNALESLSKLYFKLGDTGKAYQYLKESAIVKDSIINNNSEQKIAELQTLFDTEKKKQEIAQQALKISQRNILLVILFFVLMVSLITYYLLYNRYKLKQERRLKEEMVKEEMKRSKAVLESEENERQRLARELHDGVGQLLSATKLNLSTLHHFNNEEAIKLQNSIEILDDSIKEIRNISHNMVPDVLLKFGLKKAIADFINRINQTKKININFECIGCNEDYLNDTSKLMLYRIIQESVNNTIKYAGATQLNIQLSGDDSEITLIMEDNGNGFDVEKAMEKDGIGLKNMQLRTDYLKGKMEINSSHQNGTTILIEIPLS